VQTVHVLCAVVAPISIPLLRALFQGDSDLCGYFFLILLILIVGGSYIVNAIRLFVLSDHRVQRLTESQAGLGERDDSLREPIAPTQHVTLGDIPSEAFRGLLYLKRVNDDHSSWTLLYCCVTKQSLFCFPKKDHQLEPVLILDFSHFINAQPISAEELARRGVLPSEDAPGFFTTDNFFHLVSRKNTVDRNVYMKSKVLPATLWTAAINRESYVLPTSASTKREGATLVKQSHTTSLSSIYTPSIKSKVSLKVSSSELKKSCIKQGWMSKRGLGSKSAWRKRFFILPHTGRGIYYYSKENASKAQGYISLSKGARTEQTDQNTFTIYDPQKRRTFHLKASSPRQASEWVEAVHSLV